MHSVHEEGEGWISNSNIKSPQEFKAGAKNELLGSRADANVYCWHTPRWGSKQGKVPTTQHPRNTPTPRGGLQCDNINLLQGKTPVLQSHNMMHVMKSRHYGAIIRAEEAVVLLPQGLNAHNDAHDEETPTTLWAWN